MFDREMWHIDKWSFTLLVIYLRVKNRGKQNVLFQNYRPSFHFPIFTWPNLFQKNVSIQKISIYELQKKTLQFMTFPTITRKLFLLFPFEYLVVIHWFIHQPCSLWILIIDNRPNIFNNIHIWTVCDQTSCWIHFLFKQLWPWSTHADVHCHLGRKFSVTMQVDTLQMLLLNKFLEYQYIWLS